MMIAGRPGRWLGASASMSMALPFFYFFWFWFWFWCVTRSILACYLPASILNLVACMQQEQEKLRIPNAGLASPWLASLVTAGSQA
jgi:hypothetical protein